MQSAWCVRHPSLFTVNWHDLFATLVSFQTEQSSLLLKMHHHSHVRWEQLIPFHPIAYGGGWLTQMKSIVWNWNNWVQSVSFAQMGEFFGIVLSFTLTAAVHHSRMTQRTFPKKKSFFQSPARDLVTFPWRSFFSQNGFMGSLSYHLTQSFHGAEDSAPTAWPKFLCKFCLPFSFLRWVVFRWFIYIVGNPLCFEPS